MSSITLKKWTSVSMSAKEAAAFISNQSLLHKNNWTRTSFIKELLESTNGQNTEGMNKNHLVFC